jgi:hypothetical protein
MDEIIATIPFRNEKEESENIKKYLLSLDETEQQAILIAYSHLKTSFSILFSNGYILWKKQNIIS